MLSIYYTCILVAVTLTLVFSDDIPVSYSGSDNSTDYENVTSSSELPQYDVDHILSIILLHLEYEGLHPHDENAQETMCNAWDVYENADYVDLQPDGIEGQYCRSTYDNITCWPPSPPGVVSVRCPRLWDGVAYETDFVTKYCYANGTWEEIANYTQCQPVNVKAAYLDAATVILYVGYSLSFVSLIVAFCIFVAFKSLRCLRNYIHWNFITSFIFLYIMFFCNHQMISKSLDNLSVCRLLMTLIIYAQCTNFFWMFVEGLYLYTLVVMALKPEKMTLVKYCLIGWGTPLIITLVYAICEIQLGSGCWASVGAELTTPDGVGNNKDSVEYLEFIFVGPVIIILAMNCFFLFHIGFILMTKLKASHSFETKQYRKALRGIILLLPLLGVTGIIFVINFGPSHPVLVISNALLHSFEGFFVVLIYVFCNQEVQRVIKRKIHHWREEQSLPTRQVSRRGSHSRQNSIVSAMYAKHNGDTVVFDKARKNSKVGCCNFSKTQKAEGYNIMSTHSFDASTRQTSLDGITSEKCFTKPGFESISEVSTGQENSYSKSDNTSVVYHEKQPDSNQNVKVPSSNGSVNKLTRPTHTDSEGDTLVVKSVTAPPELNASQLQESKERIFDNSEQSSDVSEPEEHIALLEKRQEPEPPVQDEEESEDGDTEKSALMAKENEETEASDDMSVDLKNNMIIPKGLTIGTQL